MSKFFIFPPSITKITGKIKSRAYRKVHEWKDARNLRNAEHRTFDARELFFQENLTSGFNMYDMIVRLLAIENYYGKNDYGFDMYRKMQKARVGAKDDTRIERFKRLIQSYQNNGYDETSEITLTRDFHLKDGSHRMALAMFHKHYPISGQVLPLCEGREYGMETLLEYDFSPDEFKRIKARYEQLHNEIIQPFVCTIWSPAQEFFDDITQRLSLVGNIVDVKDFTLDEFNYNQLVRLIYSVDDIAKWKIEKKIENMQRGKKQRLRAVFLYIENPSFRRKASNGSTLSMRCERIKKMIRNNYKQKIDNYIHDIILHIGDNYRQNEFIANLLHFEQIPVRSIL